MLGKQYCDAKISKLHVQNNSRCAEHELNINSPKWVIKCWIKHPQVN